MDIPKRDKDGNIILDEDGKEVWEVLLEIKAIHKVLLAQNKKHFHQQMILPLQEAQRIRYCTTSLAILG